MNNAHHSVSRNRHLNGWPGLQMVTSMRQKRRNWLLMPTNDIIYPIWSSDHSTGSIVSCLCPSISNSLQVLRCESVSRKRLAIWLINIYRRWQWPIDVAQWRLICIIGMINVMWPGDCAEQNTVISSLDLRPDRLLLVVNLFQSSIGFWW